MTLQKILSLTKNVNALLCEKDKEALYRYASKVKDGGFIVDIGTAAGGSAFIMALASKPKVQVFTIDPVQNDNFLFMRNALGLEKKLVFWNGDSKDVYGHFLDTDIDMLFIDGVHSYQGVKDDYETFGSRVKKGGIVAFHDIFLYDNTIGAYVKSIAETEFSKREIVDDDWSDGRRIGLFVGVKK